MSIKKLKGFIVMPITIYTYKYILHSLDKCGFYFAYY